MKEVLQPGVGGKTSIDHGRQTMSNKNGDTSGVKSKGVAEGVPNAFRMVFSSFF
jgi:hypothetical protein